MHGISLLERGEVVEGGFVIGSDRGLGRIRFEDLEHGHETCTGWLRVIR